jgi:hypothetical protein
MDPVQDLSRATSSLLKRDRVLESAELAMQVREYICTTHSFLPMHIYVLHYPSPFILTWLVFCSGQVAEMLLDYAVAGHEEAADVPAYSHPEIPEDKIEKLNVVQVMVNPKTGKQFVRYPKEIVHYRASIPTETHGKPVEQGYGVETVIANGRRQTMQLSKDAIAQGIGSLELEFCTLYYNYMS